MKTTIILIQGGFNAVLMYYTVLSGCILQPDKHRWYLRISFIAHPVGISLSVYFTAVRIDCKLRWSITVMHSDAPPQPPPEAPLLTETQHYYV